MTQKKAKSNIFVYIVLALCAVIWLFPIIIAFVISMVLETINMYLLMRKSVISE